MTFWATLRETALEWMYGRTVLDALRALRAQERECEECERALLASWKASRQ